MKSIKTLLIAAALMTLCAVVAFGQQSATGEIRGYVTDEQGAVVVDAKIVLTNVDTALTRTLMTDGRGRYRALLLPLGNYEVVAEKESFKKWKQSGITLEVGEVLSLDITLEVGDFASVVTITGDAPVIETATTAFSSVVSEQLIENLPINGRDYRDFVLITPTAGTSSRNGVTLGGTRGVQTNLTIDGFNNNSPFFGEQNGGEINPTFTVSQESVKEFRVLNHGFSAEYGQSNGGLITVVTKSGTNDLRGTGFLFYQNEAFIADQAVPTNYGEDIDYVEQDEFERFQFGGSLGGPIVQDKAFFFASADIQLLEIPRAVRFGISDADRARWPSLAAKEQDYIETNDNYAFFTKLDYAFNENHNMTARWMYSLADQSNGLNYYATNAPETQGNEEESQNNFQATLTSFFGDNMINEMRVQYSMGTVDRTRVEENDSPQYQEGGYAWVTGATYFLPIEIDIKRFQLVDNFNVLMGDHDIKLGFDYNWTNTKEIFIGYWSGRLYFGSYDDYLSGNPYRARQRIPLGGRSMEDSGAFDFTANDLALYIQDKWQPTDRLTIDLGLRWAGVFNDEPPYPNALWPNSGELYDDTNNIAPRVGIAYDVAGDGKTVIRAAAGLFHARTPSLLFYPVFMENGAVAVVQQFSNDIPWPYNAAEVINRYAGGDYRGLDIHAIDPDFEEAETWRFNAGIERELLPNTSIGLDFMYAKGEKNQRRRDINLTLVSENGDPRGEPLYSRYPRPNGDLGAIYEMFSGGEVEYYAMTAMLKSRLAYGITAQASYTWSKDKDDDSNERDYSGVMVTDTLHPDKDYGLSDRDRTHRLVASVVWQAPFDINVSGILTLQSGRPYSAVWGSDLNGDGQYNDRAEPGSGGTVYSERNDYRRGEFKNFDLRVSKAFRIGEIELEGIFEAFNLFNWESELSIYTDSRYSSFGLPSILQDSRRLQVGGRVRF